MTTALPEAHYQRWTRLVKLLRQQGLEHVVLSPGSRSAPIALSFLRSGPQTFVVPDERAAAYLALGLSQVSRKATAIVCTSGTAALNYAPAVAEGYFQEVPLLVITADRPPEWIGQADNQAVFQAQLYGRHALASYSFPVEYSEQPQKSVPEWHAMRIINEAWRTANGLRKGPVHMNVPLREPLYMQEEMAVAGNASVLVKEPELEQRLPEEVLQQLQEKLQYILVVGGLHPPDEELTGALKLFVQTTKAVVLPDVASNMLGAAQEPLWCESAFQEGTFPEHRLLITFGGPIVSKRLKGHLRTLAGATDYQHWHIHPAGEAPDTFQRLTQVIRMQPAAFFRQISEGVREKQPTILTAAWKAASEAAGEREAERVGEDTALTEATATWHICHHLPQQSILHLGNSLPVRLVNRLGLEALRERKVTVYGNRGTSGIDGSVSSAVGNALASGRATTALIGDQSFFYDRNGLWHRHVPENFRLIVINNHGGGIFRNIHGPQHQPELESYFTNQEQLTMEHTALQHGLGYLQATSQKELLQTLKGFWKGKQPMLLEVVVAPS